MRVLLCHNFYQQYGGEDRVVEQLADLLQSRGHQVLWLREKNQALGAYGFREKLELLPDSLYSAATVRSVRALVAAERPDVAHVHNVFPRLSASVYAALRANRIPVVQTIHNFRWLCPNGLFYVNGKICRRCQAGGTWPAVQQHCLHGSLVHSAWYAAMIAFARRRHLLPIEFAQIITLNQFTAQILQDQLGVEPERLHVMGNFIPLKDSAPEPAFEGFVYMGRLSPEKGVRELVDSMASLPESRLTLIGGGPLAEDLYRRVAEGLRNVSLMGFIQGTERFAMLASARALVIPSLWYEQFPMGILEAFALGVPVIAPRLGGLAEIIEDGVSGLLYDPTQPHALTDCLRRIQADDVLARRLRLGARQCAAQRYSPDVIYPRLMQVYEQAIDSL